MLDMFLSVILQNQIPFIVMVSTPYAPDGLFDSIEKEPEESLHLQTHIVRLYLWS